MLTFTESQLDALDESCTQDFIERLTLDLKKNEVGTASELNNNELINRVKAPERITPFSPTFAS